MKVCIAEKPSVAREIASILKADSKKDGYYEGNGYQVTWTFGHFCSLYNELVSAQALQLELIEIAHKNDAVKNSDPG